MFIPSADASLSQMASFFDNAFKYIILSSDKCRLFLYNVKQSFNSTAEELNNDIYLCYWGISLSCQQVCNAQYMLDDKEDQKILRYINKNADNKKSHQISPKCVTKPAQMPVFNEQHIPDDFQDYKILQNGWQKNLRNYFVRL